MESYVGKVSGGRALSHTGSSATADGLLQGQPGDTRAEDPLRFPGNGIHPRTNTEGPLGGGLEAAPGSQGYPGALPAPQISAGCLREDVSCQGQGNRDNAGRRLGETTPLHWTQVFLSQSSTRSSCTFAAQPYVIVFFF